MRALSSINFKGEFRDYQEVVLEHAEQYLKDGKVHIVAAPGSGKTTLGLELICRQNSPALILSPTVTIRQQWGERFADGFLPEGENIDDYYSCNLRKTSQITSITYQALFAAFNKLSVKEELDDEEAESDTEMDFTDFDLLNAIIKSDIKTICLDEAHHLKSEWQKVLEAFIAALEKQVTVIALTATPPYDSSPAEWDKYINLCGEIDEEIFVPQLVVQKTLCPHQDYIYFNYPTDKEKEVFNQYKQKALLCVQEVFQSQLFDDILTKSALLTDFREKEEFILENAKGYIAILCLAKHHGIELPKKLIKLLSPSGKLPAFSLAFAETAFQFVIDSPLIFTEEVSARLYNMLHENSLLEKRQVQLKSNPKLNKLLLSSTGKLISINEIVRSELVNLNKDLRMLILTDYVRKNMMNIIGTDEPISTMGTVPIFESVRRNCGDIVNPSLLSGQVVIIPEDILPEIKSIAEQKSVSVKTKKLPNTDYLEIFFSGSNKNRVAIITEAFERGLIPVLVGTKSLLGEGWDSPCINSLILASFVGSFVLSNQMRGRAIRVDGKTPEKVSNIWHLVTVEPPYVSENKVLEILEKPLLEDKNSLESDDFETLKRRFECFLAPSYSTSIIENGIERLDIIKPPYNENGIAKINKQMLSLAADRTTVAKHWNGTVGDKEVLEMDEIPKSVQPRGFLFQNVMLGVLFSIVMSSIFRGIFDGGLRSVIANADSLWSFARGLVMLVICGYFFFVVVFRIFRYISPKRTIETLSQCVFKTLRDIHEIESKDARVITKADILGLNIYTALTNATLHEKYVFAEAIRELLSAIDNPRYILVKSYNFLFFSIKKYSHSYACPSVIATKKEYAEIFSEYLKKSTGRFSLLYTRNEMGRKELLKCRKRSYISQNDAVNRKKVTNKWG
jgi:superfamily II DNA or RNA helicase